MTNKQSSESIAKLDIISTYFPFYISSHVHRTATVSKFYMKQYAEFVAQYNKIPKQNIRYLVFLDLFHFMPDLLQNADLKLPSYIHEEFSIFYDIYILNKMIYDNTNLFINRGYSYTDSNRLVQLKDSKTLASESRLIAKVSPPLSTLSLIVASINQCANQIFAKIGNSKNSSFAILFVAAVYNVNLISGQAIQANIYTNLYFVRINLISQCAAYANKVMYSNTVNAIFAYNIVDGMDIIDTRYFVAAPHTLYNLLILNYISGAITGRTGEQVGIFIRKLLNMVSPDLYNYDISLFISVIVIYKNRLFEAYYHNLEYYMTKTNDVSTYTIEQHRDDFGGYSYIPSIRAAEYYNDIYPNYVYDTYGTKLVLTPYSSNIQDQFPYINSLYINSSHIKAQMFIKFLQTISRRVLNNANAAADMLSYLHTKIPNEVQEDVLLLMYPGLILELIETHPTFVHTNFSVLLISLLYASYNRYNADIQQHKLYIDRTDLVADLTATISFIKLNNYLINSGQAHRELFETFNTVINFLIHSQPSVYTKNYILTNVKAHFNYLVAPKYFNFVIEMYVQ